MRRQMKTVFWVGTFDSGTTKPPTNWATTTKCVTTRTRNRTAFCLWTRWTPPLTTPPVRLASSPLSSISTRRRLRTRPRNTGCCRRRSLHSASCSLHSASCGLFPCLPVSGRRTEWTFSRSVVSLLKVLVRALVTWLLQLYSSGLRFRSRIELLGETRLRRERNAWCVSVFRSMMGECVWHHLTIFQRLRLVVSSTKKCLLHCLTNTAWHQWVKTYAIDWSVRRVVCVHKTSLAKRSTLYVWFDFYARVRLESCLVDHEVVRRREDFSVSRMTLQVLFVQSGERSRAKIRVCEFGCLLLKWIKFEVFFILTERKRISPYILATGLGRFTNLTLSQEMLAQISFPRRC